MSFIRNRVALALIGLLLFGGISAAIAVFTTPQPLRAALVGAGQANGSNTGGGVGGSAATATAAASGAGVATATATTAPTATTPPAAPPTNTPAPGGQVIGVKGTVASVNASGGTFVMTVNGSPVTVVVTGSTSFSGDAKSLGALRAGWFAEVHGVMQSNGNLLATEVNASSDN